MNYVLIDDHTWRSLLPLTFTRPVSEIRIGILTIKEKWDKFFSTECSYITEQYLSEKFRIKKEPENILINSSVLPNPALVNEISLLSCGEALIKGNIFIAVRLKSNQLTQDCVFNLTEFKVISTNINFLKITYPWDIFRMNGEALQLDYNLLTYEKKSLELSKTNNILGHENIFVEEDVKAEFVTINATTGPVYIGRHSEIMEGTIIRGPFAIGEHSVIKSGTRIYGPTTIGPHSKAGGEISNSVIFAYSNKVHDGFLGNSVLGEWCNIGAGTNISNLKNNYAEVRIWSYESEKFVKTGLQFCGLIMGDHSKCGINTMFNTGTVIGVNTNIYGSGFPRNFIPSFTWGGTSGYSEYELQRAYEVAEKVMNRRNRSLDL
ncbi:MAG: GlmU family protein, partial [Bacteroidia bacterium]|nr:GlmU family protein [Bacteroidia bacterium]